MSLTFKRTDVTQTSQAERGTMCVLPLSKGKRQNKIALGDCDGVVQALGMRKKEEERNSVFKTPPGPDAITCLTLGATPEQGDKLFASSAGQVRGLSKKGKEFFKFTTNLTETIRKVHVHGSDVFVAGEYVVNQYADCKDAHFFMSNDRVNDVALAPVILPSEQNPILACKDRFVRVVQGGELYYEASVAGAASVAQVSVANGLRRVENEEEHAGRTEVVFGTEQGNVGQLFLDAERVVRGWVIDGGARGRRRGGVNAVCCEQDLTGDGVNDIVIGRDNGLLEVYSLDENGDPVKVCERDVGEAIQTVRHGRVSSPFPEILTHTFSGKVLAFTPGADTSGVDGFGFAAELDDAQAQAKKFHAASRINNLRMEMVKLEREVQEARARYAGESGSLVAADGPGRVLDHFRLDPDTGCYHLSLEAASAIRAVCIHSDVPIDLLDAVDDQATVSRSVPEARDEGARAHALATYSLAPGATRLEVRLRAIEGQAGTVKAYVIPQNAPMTCSERSYEVKPLCLHARATRVVDDGAARDDGEGGASEKSGGGGRKKPLNTLTVRGDFGMEEAHGWVAACLADVPPRPPPGRDEALYEFENVLLKTALRVVVREGEARFTSDGATPLALLKEHASREATRRRLAIRFGDALDDDTPRHFCALATPLLEKQARLVGRERLVEALKEIKMQEGGANLAGGEGAGGDANGSKRDPLGFLSEELRETLRDEARIVAEAKDQPRRLEYLHGVVKDFFVDWHKLKGASVKNQMGAVDDVLRAGEYHRLLDVIERGGA